jgi:hypothetical protein
MRHSGPWASPSRNWRLGAVIAALLTSASLAGCAGPSKPSARSTTSSAPTSSTTTTPCVAQPSHTTVGTAQMTINPGTCLKGGEVVTITGSGLKLNSPGGIAECNSAGNQPTITVAGSQVPVSCTNPLAQTASTSAMGTLDTTFKVVTGYTGPPATGKDSAGTSALTAALSFPCPPTAAQTASGASCTIAFGDAGGDQLSANIGFVPNVKPTSTEPGSNITPSSIPSL